MLSRVQLRARRLVVLALQLDKLPLEMRTGAAAAASVSIAIADYHDPNRKELQPHEHAHHPRRRRPGRPLAGQ